MTALATWELARVVGECVDNLGATVLDSDDMVAWAAEYAASGWQVFPLRGKVPAIPTAHPEGDPLRGRCKGECDNDGHGVLDATRSLHRIGTWWTSYPGANIGLRVAVHAIVIDTDPRSGGDVGLAELEARHGRLPETLTAESGRGDGGRHYYFRRPFGKITSRRLPGGVDLKTNSGYVVAPPSIHPDTGSRYRWVTEAPIADPPSWLADLLTPEPQPVFSRSKRTVFDGPSIADTFTENTSWADILEPHGWRCTSDDPDADGAIWLHPAATSACSASVRHGCLFVWSSNTPFPVSEPGSPAGLTKFRAYAHLNHGGDLSTAARALSARS